MDGLPPSPEQALEAAGAIVTRFVPKPVGRFQVRSFNQCRVDHASRYLIKGILAPRDFGLIFGQPGCGKTHLALALGVEAVKAGRSVYFSTLADVVTSLARAEREGTLRERLRFLCRPQLLIIDEIGYLPVIAGGGNLVFQLVNARYERGAMILTSNRGFAEWGDIFGSPVVATALLDRLLHHAIVVQIEGASYRLRQHADLIPENLRVRPTPPPQPSHRRRGRPPKDRSSDLPPG